MECLSVTVFEATLNNPRQSLVSVGEPVTGTIVPTLVIYEQTESVESAV